MVQADQLTTVPSNRKVCIIDSGYYQGHEDLQQATGTWDSSTGDPLRDAFGHGTHVAGTIAALANGKGVVGTTGSGQLQLHIVKVFGDDGKWAYSSNLIAALKACREATANIVSMSLGGDLQSRVENQAFANAYAAGILSVAAAGNAGNTRRSYPASYDSVISVAAINNQKVVADFSQKNADVELAAPGVAVLSTVPFSETNTATTATGVKYSGGWIENAARTTGTTAKLIDGALCSATNGGWQGSVVLCQRGTNSFYEKVNNAQRSGAVAVILYNNADGGFSGTLGDGNSSTIPAISLSLADGAALKSSSLGSAVTVVSTIVQQASGYEAWDGTSMATPHVSGVAAVIWSTNPSWTNAQIRRALQSTAQDLGSRGRDSAYGFGLVQAKAALQFLQTGK
jgi:subtilisin family serine protease